MLREADAIVVGSGAGGATVARELARAGRKVLMLEKGAHHTRFFGTHLGAAMVTDRCSLRFSKEYLQAVRAITTGGSTLLTCGTATDPPAFVADKMGIDLTAEVAEARRDLRVQPLPDSLVGDGSLRMMEAANTLGYHWTKLDKFIDPDKCDQRCPCMLICTREAKWTARRFVQEAVEQGAELVNDTEVQEVIHRGGRAVGVRASRNQVQADFHAPIVVLSAGGMGTAPILQRSGMRRAGRDGIFLDPFVVVYGSYEGKGSAHHPPMTVGSFEFYDSEGFILSPLIDPWISFGLQTALRGPQHMPKLLDYGKMLGIMVKIKDDMAGYINANGSFSKPLTADDKRKLAFGARVSEEILVKVGCDRNSIMQTTIRGAHPGGACRVGEVIDRNLMTNIDNLFVCDASIFSEALGTPVVLCVVAVAKRLAKHLLS